MTKRACPDLTAQKLERKRTCSDLTAQNLDKKDLFSESDPFYCIYRQNEDGEDSLVYRSEWIRVMINLLGVRSRIFE